MTILCCILLCLLSDDKDSEGKDKKSKVKDKDKKKEPASMFQINGDKDNKSKKKGANLCVWVCMHVCTYCIELVNNVCTHHHMITFSNLGKMKSKTTKLSHYEGIQYSSFLPVCVKKSPVWVLIHPKVLYIYCVSLIYSCLPAAKSDSDDNEEEPKATKSKKKAAAGSTSSATMFQTSETKDKDKKTKKKGKRLSW